MRHPAVCRSDDKARNGLSQGLLERVHHPNPCTWTQYISVAVAKIWGNEGRKIGNGSRIPFIDSSNPVRWAFALRLRHPHDSDGKGAPITSPMTTGESGSELHGGTTVTSSLFRCMLPYPSSFPPRYHAYMNDITWISLGEAPAEE
jgi:hypothetical protein